MNGASANATAGALPNAPMYAPRTSSGARPATTDCDVGTQTISPTTNTTITRITTQTAWVAVRSRNGRPIINIAAASFDATGIPVSERVSLSWNSPTRSGLIAVRNPQAQIS